MLALGLAAPDARAGSYVGVNSVPNPGSNPFTYSLIPFSGGTHYTRNTSGQMENLPDSGNASTYGGASGGGGQGQPPTCSGPITASYKWTPTPPLDMTSDPPPSQVIVMESCTASATISTPISMGKYDTGMGKSGAPVWGQNNNTGSTTSVRYSVQAGGPNLTLSPKVTPTSSGTQQGDGCSVSYSVTLYPVFVKPSGVNSANQALTGQQIMGTLIGPGIGKITAYTWSFTPADTVFKTYNENAASNQLVPLGTADLTGTDTTGNGISVSPINFYDRKAESLTINCSVSVTAPDGTSLSVPAKSPSISVLKPTASLNAVGTAVIDDPANLRFGGGELWANIAITVPSPFSEGSGCLCQIVTPNRSITRVPKNGKTTSTYYNKVQNPPGSNNWVQQGKGLDGYFPYQWELSLDANGQPQPPKYHATGYIWDVSTSGSSADDPYQEYTTQDLDGGGTDWRTSKASDSFNTWVMYKPPPDSVGPSVWVPLQIIVWSWTGTATKNITTGVWSTIGSVTTPANGTDTNDPPQWNSVDEAIDLLHW